MKHAKVLFVLDLSASMTGMKLHLLNSSMRTAVDTLRLEASTIGTAEVWFGAIGFSTGARWLTDGFERVTTVQWTDVHAGGPTDMGSGIDLVTQYLETTAPVTETSLLIVLATDGQATDDYPSALRRLLANPRGCRAKRVAVCIGHDADANALELFTSPNTPVVYVRESDEWGTSAWGHGDEGQPVSPTTWKPSPKGPLQGTAPLV